MTEPRVTPPEPVELVSATEAASLIQEADRELAALERRAQESRATADAVEAHAGEEGADERTSTWAIVRLQRFIDGLRAEAERDAETVVEAARRGAHEWSEEQRADEARMRHVLLSVVRPAPPADVVEAPTPAPVAAVAPVEYPVVEPAPAAVTPTAEPQPQAAVVPPVPETSVSWAPIATPVPPATNGNAPAVVAPAADAAPVVAPPVVVAAPVEPPASVAPAPAALAPIAAAPAPIAAKPAPIAAKPAPIAAKPAPKKRFLRGFPISAVLEVLAVLLVLLFILLRLS